MNSLSEIKDTIKAYPISEIVGHFMSIVKKGQNYEGVCPFHSDSRPSLKVNDHKGLYKCFACNAGGDAIGFVERFRNVQFIEAMKIITEVTGMNVDWEALDSNKKKNPKFDRAYWLMNMANTLYLQAARNQHKEYFTTFLNDRDLSPKMADLFQIGLCPSQNLLSQELGKVSDERKKAALIEMSTSLGLTRQYEPKPMFDFFYNRITFPIHNEFGKVVAFSCRRINEQVEPKYINSKESFIFHKETILYGLYFAKQYIREKDQVILVEGNMDVITLFHYGFNNAVAAMGTSLSKKAIQKLAKMTQNIVFAFDSDTAGIDAMRRSLPLFLQEGINPRTVDFGEHKDADEYLKNHGKIELKTLVDESPSLLDKTLNDMCENSLTNQSSSEQKILIFEQACELLSHHKNQILAIEVLMQFVQKLGMNAPKDDLIERFKNISEKQKKQTTNNFKKSSASVARISQADETPPIETMPPMDEQIPVELVENEAQLSNEIRVNPPVEKAPKPLTRLQLKFLGDLIHFPFLTKNDKVKQVTEIIDNEEVRKLTQLVNITYLECPKEDYINNIQSLLENGQFSNIIKNTVLSSLFNYDDQQLSSEKSNKLLDDYGLKLKEEQLTLIKKDLIQKQKSAHLEEEAINLLVSINKVNQEILELRQNKNI